MGDWLWGHLISNWTTQKVYVQGWVVFEVKRKNMHESLNTSWGRDVRKSCESLDPNYTPGNQTWKLKMDHLKMYFLLTMLMFFIPMLLYVHLLEGDMIKCWKYWMRSLDVMINYCNIMLYICIHDFAWMTDLSWPFCGDFTLPKLAVRPVKMVVGRQF